MTLGGVRSAAWLIMASLASPAVIAQQERATPATETAAQASELSQTSVAPKQETQEASPNAIKVHGAWTIEVRNSDGSLVSHREFENALTTGQNRGDLSLALLLGRQNSMGNWTVGLYAPANQPGACPSHSTSTGFCVVTEIAEPNTDYVFPTLKATVPDTGTNKGKLVLSGSAVATGTGQIGGVTTGFRLCAPSVAASNPCNPTSLPGAGELGVTFSSATLTAPISVVAGQTVNVTVVFSFS